MSYALTDHVPVTYADRVSSPPTTPPLFISLYRARSLSLSLSLCLPLSLSVSLPPPEIVCVCARGVARVAALSA